MPNSIRNMVTPPRNSTQREPQQPVPQPQAHQPSAPQPAAVDETAIRAQVYAEQRNRVNGINDLFAMFGGKHQNCKTSVLRIPIALLSRRKMFCWLLLARLLLHRTKANSRIFMPETGILLVMASARR